MDIYLFCLLHTYKQISNIYVLYIYHYFTYIRNLLEFQRPQATPILFKTCFRRPAYELVLASGRLGPDSDLLCDRGGGKPYGVVDTAWTLGWEVIGHGGWHHFPWLNEDEYGQLNPMRWHLRDRDLDTGEKIQESQFMFGKLLGSICSILKSYLVRFGALLGGRSDRGSLGITFHCALFGSDSWHCWYGTNILPNDSPTGFSMFFSWDWRHKTPW